MMDIAPGNPSWNHCSRVIPENQNTSRRPSDLHERTGAGIVAARTRKNLTQADLARAAKISRQALFQIETGKVLPRVDTALRIARILGMQTEALFSPEEEPGIFVETEHPDENLRVDVVRLDGRWIAHPSDDPDCLGAGFSPSDGILIRESAGMKLDTPASEETLAENIFLAGCDPALDLLSQGASRTVRQGRCIWIPCGNASALGRLVRGEAHVAGVHFGGKSAEANLEAVRKLGLDKSCMMLRFSSWEQGWMISRNAGKSFRGIESLAGTKLRLANREAGSGCRIEFDRMARRAGISAGKIKGYNSITTNHAGCARQIASGFADVGLGCAAMAKTFGLAFTPTAMVAFDLVIRRDQLAKPLVRAICNLIQSGKFLRELACIPGYETSASGHVVLA